MAKSKKSECTNILFVCLGNICRSPAAEAVLKKQASLHDLEGKLYIDSCGTGSWHVGEKADARMMKAASEKGIEITSIGEQISRAHLETFDLILVADQTNYVDVMNLARIKEEQEKIYLMTSFVPHLKGKEIPDPYFGGEEGFSQVLDLLEVCALGVLQHLFPASFKQEVSPEA